MTKTTSYLTGTDMFCGAGGTTSGAKDAGVEIKMAMNHWALAIESHNTNHPETDHDCADISQSDPRRYKPTTFLFASPECTTHSNARGLKKNQPDLFNNYKPDPSIERSRATMWDVPRFAEVHEYKFIVVENVVEIKAWPMYRAWIMAMQALGYEFEEKFLNSMFFNPCPQSRDRIYVVFWKKGNPKPNLEHRPRGYCNHCEKDKETYQWFKPGGSFKKKYRTQYIYRCADCNREVVPYYYAAFNVIDWSIPGKKIGGRKKPLVDKTRKRIQFGIDKYWDKPFMVGNYTPGWTREMTEQMGAITTSDHHGFVQPFLLSTEFNNREPKSLDEVMWTQTGSQSAGLFIPFVVEMNRTGKARSVNDFLSTILTSGTHHGLTTIPVMVNNKGQSKASSSLEPMKSITTEPYHGIVTAESFRAFLSYYNGNDGASSLSDPAGTVTAFDRLAIVAGDKPNIDDCYYRTLKPHELLRGMAFAPDYVIIGNQKEQTKQIGNAVTPPVTKWLTERLVETFK